MGTQIEISPGKERLKKEHPRLPQTYAKLVARRDEMLSIERPRPEIVYMGSIGQSLLDKVAIESEIAWLKVERDPLQANINRGEQPSSAECRK